MKKYFIFALIIGILVLPRLSLAMTSAEIQAQINAIMAQIQALQQQIAQLQAQQAGTLWCHDFNVNLKIGDSGSEVVALTTALIKEGFSASGSAFDESVALAVTGFQQKYADEVLAPWGLKYGTGFVGKTTRAKLNQLYGCGVVAAPIVGGQCTYQQAVGVCTIISIHAGTVDFNFAASPIASFPSFFNPDVSQQGNLATLTSGWTDTDRNSLKVGSQVNCTVKTITGGTCTPVIFNFNNR